MVGYSAGWYVWQNGEGELFGRSFGGLESMEAREKEASSVAVAFLMWVLVLLVHVASMLACVFFKLLFCVSASACFVQCCGFWRCVPVSLCVERPVYAPLGSDALENKQTVLIVILLRFARVRHRGIVWL